MTISWNGEHAPVPNASSYGYARVSTTDQDLTVQYEALEKAGCRVIRAEKVSGSSVQGRQELRTLLDFIRDGDELVVTPGLTHEPISDRPQDLAHPFGV